MIIITVSIINRKIERKFCLNNTVHLLLTEFGFMAKNRKIYGCVVDPGQKVFRQKYIQ